MSEIEKTIKVVKNCILIISFVCVKRIDYILQLYLQSFITLLLDFYDEKHTKIVPAINHLKQE